MKGLHIQGVSHAYGKNKVLDNVSLAIPAGELVCLLGPSGCGKTTLLRLAAGLEKLQHGQIVIDETVVAEPGMHVEPEHRKVGLMFQDYALFPHLNILENVLFGLAHLRHETAKHRALDMLDQVGMASFADDHPHMLSGGQQQRIALARALAPDPKLLLLDEPFSGLDTTMRSKIREETLMVLKNTGVATLMVTHDPEEAMFMADRIKILGADGSVLQSGPPSEIYYSPRHKSVARLFGSPNEFTGTVKDGVALSPLGPVPATGFADHSKVKIVIRTEGVILEPGGKSPGAIPVEITARNLISFSSIVRAIIPSGDYAGTEIRARINSSFDPTRHPVITARIDVRHAFVYLIEDKGNENG